MDIAPILYAFLSFKMIFESLDQFYLSISVIDVAKKSLKYHFNAIRCDSHTLSVILDPLVPKLLWIEFQYFYDSEQLNTAPKRAFENACD